MNVAHNRALSIAFAALLLFSVISVLPASALSPITFTNETTVNSQHEQFQQVYENGTSSSVYLDANSTGSYFMDSWDGSTLTSLDSMLTNSTYLVDSHAYISPVDLSRYSLLFDGSTEYGQMASAATFDITTQDFAIAIIVYRNTDSGGIEKIVSKRGPNDLFEGYQFYITAADKIAAELVVADTRVTVTSTASIATSKPYLIIVSYDRSANLTLWIYDINLSSLTSNSASIAALSGTATSTRGFTIARAGSTEVGSHFCPCTLDDLMFWDGYAVTSDDVNELITGDIDAVTTATSRYDMNDGFGTTLNDEIASNNMPLFNTPTWSSNVASISQSRPTIYVTGRDSDNSTNGYGKWNLADLSQVDDEYFSSDLAPLDIAQSTSNLYAAAINGTDYGTLFDVSLTRSFGSYTETSIHTGDVTTPAFGLFMDVPATTDDVELYTTVREGAAQDVDMAASVLNGKTLEGIVMTLSKEGTPPGDATVGVMDSSNNIVFTCATFTADDLLTTSAANYTFFCPSTHTIEVDDFIGINYGSGDVSNNIHVHYNSAGGFDGTNSLAREYDGSWTTMPQGGASADMTMKILTMDTQVVVYDGSPDTRYYFFESDDELRAVKRTGSTSLIATAMSHAVGEPFSVIQLTDRIIIQTATDVYQLLTATDAITQLHTNSFNTRYPQTFEIAPAARTFNSDAVMMANSTYAENWDPSDGSNEQTAVFIDDVDSGASSIDPYDPTKYYFMPENDLTVEATSASDTSWQVKDVGSRVTLEPTAYSERLTVPLQENRTLFTENVFRLVCDANYELDALTFEIFAVGSDADCQFWRVLAESDDSVGRELMPYARQVDLVHTSPYTTYGFELETTNPIIYTLESSYDSKAVDSGDFDSGGQAQQRYLFGQCYSITVTDVNTGEVALAGTACANDFTTKTISLSGVTIPDPLVHPSWNYIVERDTTNPASNIISGNVSSTTTPFNATIYVADHFIGAYKTFEQTLNYTNVNLANFTINGITENQTLYFSVFDGDGDPAVNFQSQGNFLNLDMSFLDVFGEFFGIPLIGLFVIIFAGIFTKSNAYFGVFATAAVVGVLSVIGLLDIASNMWTLILIVAALGMFGARRFL